MSVIISQLTLSYIDVSPKLRYRGTGMLPLFVSISPSSMCRSISPEVSRFVELFVSHLQLMLQSSPSGPSSSSTFHLLSIVVIVVTCTTLILFISIHPHLDAFVLQRLTSIHNTFQIRTRVLLNTRVHSDVMVIHTRPKLQRLLLTAHLCRITTRIS